MKTLCTYCPTRATKRVEVEVEQLTHLIPVCDKCGEEKKHKKD